MKYILKSGRGFVKREKDIIMYPACKGGEKVIHSPCIKELWEEMKYLDKNFSYNNIDIYNLLKENSLVFEINEDEWDDYQRLSRNIQFLSLHNDIEPNLQYKSIIDKKILIIGLGTVGAPLVYELDKFGFKNIVVIDGDSVELKNITAQLGYSISDVGQLKTKTLREKISSIKETIDDYLSVDNIEKNLYDIKPDIIFCCADDSTGNLIKLLISKMSKYNYTLFLTGYSQEELIVYHITKENQQVFLNYFNEQPYLLKTHFISHNTGTIAKGLMSASLAFNTLIKSFYLKVDDILFFNFRLNTIYTQNLRYLNLNEFEKRYIFRNIEQEILKIEYILQHTTDFDKEEIIKKVFEFNYYTYLTFCTDITNQNYKYLNNHLDFLFNRIYGDSIEDHFRSEILQLETLKADYYKKNGIPIVNYSKFRRNIPIFDDILLDYKNFVFSPKFKDVYNSLLNKRKKFIENISRQLKTRYGFDFIELISKNLRVSINTKNLDKYDFLEFEFLESEKIVATDAFEMILRAIDDKEFFNFVENYRNNGFIDCEKRAGKTHKNFTLYNPYTKTSKIIMTYQENFMGVMRLSHELMHAYSYDLFKERLHLNELYKIPKSFWEIFAKLGELFVADSQEKLSVFFRKSFYQYVFCQIDYNVLNLSKNSSIEDILKIKSEFFNSIGLLPELLEYTQYNFIDYSMLYSKHFYAYDAVFSDIIALGIYKYSKKLNYSFGEIISIIASISTFTIDSIKNEFNIEIESLIESYVSEINNFLNNYFLEEMKDEYFKGK